jgi:hypothetical protein
MVSIQERVIVARVQYLKVFVSKLNVPFSEFSQSRICSFWTVVFLNAFFGMCSF